MFKDPLCFLPLTPVLLPSLPIPMLPITSFFSKKYLQMPMREGERWAPERAEEERGAMPYPLLF